MQLTHNGRQNFDLSVKASGGLTRWPSIPYLFNCNPRLINIFSSSFVWLTFKGGLLTGAANIFLTHDLKKKFFIKTCDVAMCKFSSPQKREKVLTAFLVHGHVFVLGTELWCLTFLATIVKLM